LTTSEVTHAGRSWETYFTDLGNFRRCVEFWYSFQSVREGLAWIEALKTKYLPSLRPTNPNNKVAVCIGQFITANVVLTAGHCLKNLQTNPTGPWIDLTKQTFRLQHQNREGTQFKVVCGAINPYGCSGRTTPRWRRPSRTPRC
jgi:hypothetical protein